jgi:hypothetical protein
MSSLKKQHRHRSLAEQGECNECKRRHRRRRLTLALGLAFVFFVLFLLCFNHGFLFTLLVGIAPGRFSVAPSPAERELRDVITVASIFKNEGKYMREWVEHHLALGVDSFLLFDDTASCDPFPARHVLQRYIDSGQVELVPVSHWDGSMFFLSSDWSVLQSAGYKQMPWQLFFHSKQQRALVEAWHRLLARASSRHHHWLALLDVDEFYNPHGNDLRALLRRQRLRGARTVHMGKLDFGPSATVRRPEDGLVRPHYIYRDAVPERVGSITLVRSIAGMAPYCVHTFQVNSLVGDMLFGGADCNRWPGNHMGGRLHRHIYYAPPDELAVHHYKTKSLEECCEHQNVVSVNSMRIKDRRCQADAMSEVCDDSLLRYVAGMEDRRPCTTDPSPFVRRAGEAGLATEAQGMAAASASAAAAASAIAHVSMPAAPSELFCQTLQSEIEAERAIAARLSKVIEARHHHGRPKHEQTTAEGDSTHT